jgi:Asp-tRNA(Asn)/Glu-tRNA(Gln) amidotransferase C subunit
VTAEDIEHLADIAGLSVPAEDLQPLAEALAAHLEFVEPLLRRDLSAFEPVLRFEADD